MPAYDFRSPRLFVAAPLAAGATLSLDRAQGHYLTTVLRRKSGDGVLVFNGHDGEWSAEIEGRKRDVALRLGAKVRDQTAPADLHYLFAPLKSARLDYMVQKAVEMGAARLQAGAHPPRPGGEGQSRAHAGERHRSRRAMRHPFAS